MAAREADLKALLGEALLAKVKDAKLLVIGAGGIGCELLKNLVLTGFQDIEVVDLDTIDVSNLNRQFLFRPHHVGKSKAEVAREAVLEFNPSARIVAYHANIKEDRFGVEYFENFDIVINALDNVAARKHVNRLCLATNKPLIEAGTQGYEGQAYLIKKGVTECFECVPKPIQKKFPVCTIRSTPDKPVHCVVWAKELHKLLLGDVKTSYLYEETTGAEAPAAGSDDGAAPARAESVYMHLVTDRLATMDDAQATAYARDVFQAIFHDEIAKRLEMAPETYKTAARPPQPLDLTKVERGAYPDSTNAAGGAGAGAPGGRNGRLRDQMVLSLQESAELFVTTLAGYFKDAANAPNIGALEFNKDSAADLHLVTAATNLRAYTFGIPTQSRFDVKSIAGNIIPAIATTNAVVAGLQVMEALKILRGDDVMQTGKYTYCKRLESTSKRALLMATSLCPPNKNCIVCGTMGLTLFIDTRKTTLKTFVDVILKTTLSFVKPNIDNGKTFDFTDQDEDDDDPERRAAWLETPMAGQVGGGLGDGIMASITDFGLGDLSMNITIRHKDRESFDELKHPQFFEIVGDFEAATTAAKLEAESAAVSHAAAGSGAGAGAAQMAGTSSAPPAHSGQKRKLSAAEQPSGAKTRIDTAAPSSSSNAAAVVEDANGDIIVLDNDDSEEAGAAAASATMPSCTSPALAGAVVDDGVIELE